MKPTVLGICGPAGVGKSTTAKAVMDSWKSRSQPAAILPFAEPLKELACEFFGWDGRKDARGRRLLQQLGTDVARTWDPDFWVKKWTPSAESLLARGYSVVADDVRFANEAEAIRLLGGIVVRLYHPRGTSATHPSEALDFKSDLHIEMGDMSPEQIAQELDTWFDFREGTH